MEIPNNLPVVPGELGTDHSSVTPGSKPSDPAQNDAAPEPQDKQTLQPISTSSMAGQGSSDFRALRSQGLLRQTLLFLGKGNCMRASMSNSLFREGFPDPSLSCQMVGDSTVPFAFPRTLLCSQFYFNRYIENCLHWV